MFDSFTNATVERDLLSDEELVELLTVRNRQLSHLHAEFYADVKAVADRVAKVDPSVGYEYAADEVAAALTWTRRAAETAFNLAWDLDELPEVREALSAGQIDLAKAKTIIYGVTGIEREEAKAVVRKVLERAEKQTTGQIRARLRRLLLEVNPQAAVDRYQAGLKERKVILDANDDGTANLHLYNLPPDQAALAFDRLDDHARVLATREEPRTLDQLRADVATDLLIGCLEHAQRGRKPIVDIRVDLTTLLELNDSPGEIPGYGPVIADIARQLADQQHSRMALLGNRRVRTRCGRNHSTTTDSAPASPDRNPPPHVRLPRLPGPLHPRRPRPPPTLGRRRTHRRSQPQSPLRPSPPRQRRRWLAHRNDRPTHFRMDQPPRHQTSSRDRTALGPAPTSAHSG